MNTELIVLSLRRTVSDKSWGFVLQGGSDQGLPVFVHKVTRNGIAHKCGLEPGDVIIKICESTLLGKTYAQVKAEILRAGNELDFSVKKKSFNVSAYNATMNQLYEAQNSKAPMSSASKPQAEIIEEHVWKHGGPTFKNIQPKSYKILEQQLPEAEQNKSRPTSVLDRDFDERSTYLKATAKTIQRSYGEN